MKEIKKRKNDEGRGKEDDSRENKKRKKETIRRKWMNCWLIDWFLFCRLFKAKMYFEL